MASSTQPKGLRFGVALFLCALLPAMACGKGASEDKGTETASKAEAASEHAVLAVQVSINGETPKGLSIALDADGFSKPLLAQLKPPSESPWASIVVNGKAEARLLLSLRHYPKDVFALRKAPTSGVVQAGLRDPKGAFKSGFVTSAPSLITVFDKAHLENKARPSALALSVLTVAGDTKRFGAEDYAVKKKVRLPGKTSKEPKWVPIPEILGPIPEATSAGTELRLMGAGPSAEVLLTVPTKSLLVTPSPLHIKLNRKGEWKFVYSGGEGGEPVSGVVASLELRPANSAAP